MLSLQSYGESDEDSDNKESNTSTVLSGAVSYDTHPRLPMLPACPAPDVFAAGSTVAPKELAHNENVVDYNVKYEDLFTPPEGPRNITDSGPSLTDNNTLTGSIEPAHVNNFQFENQRKTFHAYRYASDPSLNSESLLGKNYVGDLQTAYDTDGRTVFESTNITKKRKQERNDNPSDVKGFLGPWGKFADEQRTSKPTEEERAALEEILAKKHKRGKINEDLPLEEKSILHISNALDYQGRSFLHIPNDVGVNLRSDVPPSKCFLPKSHIHTWEGHTKGISTMKWFPRSAHLLLSASMDCRIKLWEVYQDKRCIRTYIGHRQAVKDVCWNNKGTQFLSAGYDRYIKLWDTETGDVISRFSSRKIPFCIKFHPDNNKQHLFVAGTSDKKIISWDIRCGEIVQEYDRHLGAVNTITFVDENRRFVTTSDDKSMRIWEWDIPVDMKYIADPTMHSMPAVTLAPNGKWLACQSLDNKIVVFSAMNRFKINRKKSFSGHMVSGYACTVDFSPDMSYLVSGDGDGKCYIWDWKTTKLYKKWQAHDGVCINTLWHPHEPSKLATAGWDGLIKFWD